MLNVGTSTPLEIDGVAAAWADIDVTGLAGSGYPHIDFGADERGIVDFAFPGRLFVIPSGDGVFLVHIYAGTDEDLAAWLPEASQIVESITFR
jgi:hypothetical protein